MPKRKLPPNDEVIKMYQDGMSSGEIAELCDVQPVTVISLLRRLDIPRRSPGEASRNMVSRGRAIPTRYWLGKTQPPEMVEKRVSKIRGENHYAWSGGKDRRGYRNNIDKIICDECACHDNLCIHHTNFDHYDNREDNLRVLCVSCHLALHKQAYWDSIHSGEKPLTSNGPVGWTTKKGGS
jgi:hypothetical protein